MRKQDTYFNKIISIFITITFLTPNVLFAQTTPSNAPSSATATIVCDTATSSQYYPVGDTLGKNVLTKIEYTRNCNSTIVEQGACSRWEERAIERSLLPSDYDSYETSNFQDSIGTLLATLGAYDQIEHMWSGWKGYCEIGTKTDFSWAQDPMFWASMAMSFVMSSTGPGDVVKDAAADAATDAVADAAVDAATDAATDAAAEAATSSGKGLLTDTVVGQTFNSAASEIGNYASDALVGLGMEGIQKEASERIGRCLIAGGMNMVSSLYSAANTISGSPEECDPIDEVCSTRDEAEVNESSILTMDETHFADMIQKFASEGNNLYDYIYEYPNSPENGIHTFRMKQKNEIPGFASMDQSGMDELTEKIDTIRIGMSIAMTSMSLANCVGNYFSFSGDVDADVKTTTKKGDGRMSIQNLGSMVIDQIAKFAGPWGPVIAVVAKLILYVATSFKKIDTCNNENDAKEAGSRHERTQKSLKFNLCHKVGKKCVENGFMSGLTGKDCSLWGYTYCCYDQIMTKVLVEQIKAQLGRDWAHCTGITLRDLNYISLRQCTSAEMQTGFDGAHKEGIYDPTGSFQYKNRCVDMGEFLEYLRATVGEDIQMSDFETFWNDMSRESIKQGHTK